MGLFGYLFSCLSFLFSFSLSLGDGTIQTEILSQRAVKAKTTNQPMYSAQMHYDTITLQPIQALEEFYSTICHSVSWQPELEAKCEKDNYKRWEKALFRSPGRSPEELMHYPPPPPPQRRRRRPHLR